MGGKQDLRINNNPDDLDYAFKEENLDSESTGVQRRKRFGTVMHELMHAIGK